MPKKPRDYVKENIYKAQRDQIEKRVARNAARRELMRAGKVRKGDGKDVDHKQMLSKGGTNAPGNLRVVSASANRSFPRNPDGSAKSNGASKKK